MPTASTKQPSDRPLLGLSPAMCRALGQVAFFWALLAIGGLAIAGPLDLLDHRPGGTAFEINERPVFMLLFAVGVVLALRWEIVGGTIAAFTASALLVFATQQLRPASAVFVIVAFAVPAVLWILIDLNDQRPGIAALGLVVASSAVVLGAVMADAIYDRVFGPTHPGSETAELPDSELEWIWSGAVTERGFSVTAKVSDDDAESVRLVVGSGRDLTDGQPSPTGVSPDDDGVVGLAVEGLAADTTYHYALEVDGVVDLVRTGTVRTLPTGPSSFTIAIGSDARVGSNGAVFDAIRAVNPLLYVIVGDLHYGDIDRADPDLFEEVFDLTLTRPAQAALYRSAPVAYVWDDHDFGGNGSDPDTPSAPTALEAFRRHVPHYPLAGTETPVYQAFSVGRVRFVLTDGRAARSPTSTADDADKTMLGAEQKAWFKAELLAATDDHELVIWVNPVPWIAEAQSGGDNWGGYTTERRELADFIADNGIGDAMLMVSGDAHMLAVDDGTNSDYSATGGAAFPVVHAAALDRPGEIKGGPYSEGAIAGGGQFGVLTVADDGGETITVSLSGRNWKGEELIAYQFDVPHR